MSTLHPASIFAVFTSPVTRDADDEMTGHLYSGSPTVNNSHSSCRCLSNSLLLLIALGDYSSSVLRYLELLDVHQAVQQQVALVNGAPNSKLTYVA